MHRAIAQKISKADIIHPVIMYYLKSDIAFTLHYSILLGNSTCQRSPHYN